MTTSRLRLITSDEQHEAALAEIDRLLLNKPAAGSEEEDRLAVLAVLVESYERARFPIARPTVDFDITSCLMHAANVAADPEVDGEARAVVLELATRLRSLAMRPEGASPYRGIPAAQEYQRYAAKVEERNDCCDTHGSTHAPDCEVFVSRPGKSDEERAREIVESMPVLSRPFSEVESYVQRIAAALAEERESCARVAEDLGVDDPGEIDGRDHDALLRACAARIRARGKRRG